MGLTAARDNATESIGTDRARRVLGLLGGLSIGIVMAGQSRINGELGHRLEDGILAALISFGGGWLLLVLALPVVPPLRRRLRQVISSVRQGGLPPWYLAAGVGGAFFVLGQGLVVASLGVALFTVTVVAGQTISALLVDRVGVGPAGSQALTPNRMVGAVVAIGAVVVAVWDRLAIPGTAALVIVPALAGIAVAWQQAFNGRVGEVGGPFSAATTNFTAGTLVLVLAAVVDVAVRGLPDRMPTAPILYLGGLLGIVFVALAAIVVSMVGVLLLGLTTVAGQLIGAVLLDLLFPTVGTQLSGYTFAGVAVTLLAVLIASRKWH